MIDTTGALVVWFGLRRFNRQVVESMPRIFGNLIPQSQLLPALQETLRLASRADFYVGYFNLRGWQGLGQEIERWPEGAGPCRVLMVCRRSLTTSSSEQLIEIIEQGWPRRELIPPCHLYLKRA